MRADIPVGTSADLSQKLNSQTLNEVVANDFGLISVASDIVE